MMIYNIYWSSVLVAFIGGIIVSNDKTIYEYHIKENRPKESWFIKLIMRLFFLLCPILNTIVAFLFVGNYTFLKKVMPWYKK